MDDALAVLGDPNVAFILFAAGLLALLAEVHAPTILGGVAGVAALILALVGFSRLPVDVAGIALIVGAVILFVLELNLASHGLLGLAGVVAFTVGASMLYHADAAGAPVSVSPAVIGVMVAVRPMLVVSVPANSERVRLTSGMAESAAVPASAPSVSRMTSVVSSARTNEETMRAAPEIGRAHV